MNYQILRQKAIKDNQNIVEVVSQQIQEVLAVDLNAQDFVKIKNYGFTFVLDDCRFKIAIIRVKK